MPVVTKTKTERPFSTQLHYRRTVPFSGSPSLVVSNLSKSSGLLTSSRTGINNPSYRWQILTGENATTALTAVERRVSFKPAHYHMIVKSPFLQSTVYYDSDYAPDVPVVGSLPDLTRAENEAAMKFYRNAWKEIRSFQGATFLGEVAESLRMLKNPVKSFRRGFDDFISTVKKRSKGLRIPPSSKRRKQKLRELIGDTYLEFAFGWRPLVNSAYDALLALDSLSQAQRPFRMVRGSGLSVAKGPVSSTANVNVNGFGQTGKEYSYSSTEARVKYYGMVYISEGYGIPPARSLLGFDLPTAAQAGWELLPWSFLIDYFTNVGNLIEAWTFPVGRLKWVSRTTVQKSEATAVAFSERSHQNLVGLGGSGASLLGFSASNSMTSSYRKDVSRSPSISYPVVRLQLEIPGMADLRWLNIAALVAARRSPPT